MRILINESQLYTLVNVVKTEKTYDINESEMTPLSLLRECRYSLDGKYVVFRNKLYSSITGEEIPRHLMEAWSLSDILHTAVDVVSAGADFVAPGSGAVIDAAHAASYIVEAQFKPEQERNSLYLMALITFAFVVIPGPLQAASAPLKSAVKAGKMSDPIVKKMMPTIAKYSSKIVNAIPNLVKQAVDSAIGKKILGKYSGKIAKAMTSFTTKITKMLEPYAAKTAGKAGAEVGTKAGAKVAGKAGTKAAGKAGTKTAGKIVKGQLNAGNVKALTSALKGAKKLKSPLKVLSKLGIQPGKAYRVILKNGKATKGTFLKMDKGFAILKYGNNKLVKLTPEQLIQGVILKPWLRQGKNVAVPFFIKRFADYVLPDGTVDEESLNQLEDISSDSVSQESLGFMQEELAGYEGDTGSYSQNQTVTDFQNGLMSLNYNLKFGADGKFGPETMGQLKKFQTDNGIPETSLGRMDRLTAKKMAEMLAAKNDPNTKPTQDSLTAYATPKAPAETGGETAEQPVV